MILIDGNKTYEFGTNRKIVITSEKNVENKMEIAMFKKIQDSLLKKFRGAKSFSLEISGIKYSISRTAYDYILERVNKQGIESTIGNFMRAEDLVYLIFRDIIGRSSKKVNKEEFLEFITKIYKYIAVKGVTSYE